MPIKNALIVVVDRLSAAYLGPYGNTWIETPEFNRLASQSMLFEFATSHSPQLSEAYRAFWLGQVEAADSAPRPLAAQLSAAGIHTALVTDEQQVHSHEWAFPFGIREFVPHEAAREQSDPLDTEMARLFAAAAETLHSLQPPFCLWVHARGLAGAWDAPYEYRRQFADEDDPLPTDTVTPPALLLAGNYDPDELWGYARAYAGQVLVLDTCIGALRAALDASLHSSSTLLVVTSPRGFPMGEHGRVGDVEPALYGELLHVPLFIHHPQHVAATLRRQGLAQLNDVWATLMAWFEQSAVPEAVSSVDLLANYDDPVDDIRSHVIARHQAEIAMRTRHWFYRQIAEREELYAKPDDRFEANEVASRAPDVVDELGEMLKRESGDGLRRPPGGPLG